MLCFNQKYLNIVNDIYFIDNKIFLLLTKVMIMGRPQKYEDSKLVGLRLPKNFIEQCPEDKELVDWIREDLLKLSKDGTEHVGNIDNEIIEVKPRANGKNMELLKRMMYVFAFKNIEANIFTEDEETYLMELYAKIEPEEKENWKVNIK